MFDGKVDREIYLFPTSASRLPLITTPSPSPSRIITHRCRNNLIICRADDRSRILLVKNVSPPLLFPLRAEIGRSISMFPPRNFSHPSRNVDNFVRFRKDRVKFFLFIFEIRKNINCEIFVSRLILVFLVDFIFCSFFLSFWGWFK